MQTNQPQAPISEEQLLRDVITEVTSALDSNVDYTSAQILPAKLWASFTDGARRSIGKTLSRLAEQGLVPLVKTSPPYKMPVTYRRR